MAKMHFSGIKFPSDRARVKANHKSTYKKVVVRRLDHGIIKGFVDANSFLKPDASRCLTAKAGLSLSP